MQKSGSIYRAALIDKPPRNGFIASADYLFHSMASFGNPRILGMILSGMGNDGADGTLALKDAGGATLGENESSCLVYGMSKAAAQLGALQAEKSIQELLKILNGRPVN